MLGAGERSTAVRARTAVLSHQHTKSNYPVGTPTGVTAARSSSPGADAEDALDRQHEDLAVADVAGARGGADGVDRRLDEVIGDADLEPHFLRQLHLHGRAAVGLDALRSRRRVPARG